MYFWGRENNGGRGGGGAYRVRQSMSSHVEHRSYDFADHSMSCLSSPALDKGRSWPCRLLQLPWVAQDAAKMVKLFYLFLLFIICIFEKKSVTIGNFLQPYYWRHLLSEASNVAMSGGSSLYVRSVFCRPLVGLNKDPGAIYCQEYTMQCLQPHYWRHLLSEVRNFARSGEPTFLKNYIARLVSMAV